jgi:hypothetical protein
VTGDLLCVVNVIVVGREWSRLLYVRGAVELPQSFPKTQNRLDRMTEFQSLRRDRCGYSGDKVCP